MTAGTRTAFDPTLPFVVVTSELAYGPARLMRGDAFDWRGLGVTDYELVQLWMSLKIDNVIVDPLPIAPSRPLTVDPPKHTGRRDKR